MTLLLYVVVSVLRFRSATASTTTVFYVLVLIMKFSNKLIRIISVISLSVGIGLVVAGVFRGEAETVFNKATRICMECIGIG